MDITKYYAIPGVKPLDSIPADGGFAGIFRTIGCIGDSLSSGEFESLDEAGNRGYHDMFAYSWGQYLGRLVGAQVLNFSRGGMTAKEYMESFAEQNDYWNPDKQRDSQLPGKMVIYGLRGRISNFVGEGFPLPPWVNNVSSSLCGGGKMYVFINRPPQLEA